ncbi:putative membrane protein [Streptohalobacillus salinus]|uniref:Putative membrane protein n=1 Tax=Streptohalobacillus salinus TaxID=621096 RepID=A0A2V3VVT6_9BACI|nr:ECF transporter S component [Streptohalobacillus salinus]PXW86102.1 putative membrane protein [Streptohalobacillus salinus]
MKIKDFTLTAIFISIILLFAFTPIGFIHLGVIKATLIHIPVIIGSIILGPKIGAILGLTFGFTSVITNTIAPSLLSFAFSPAIPVLGTDQGSFWALVVALVPRMIIGIIPYFIYRFFKQKLSNRIQEKAALFITGLVSTVIHTFLVLGAIALLFTDAYAQAIDATSGSAIFIAVMTVFLSNGVGEALVAAFIVTMIIPPLLRISK